VAFGPQVDGRAPVVEGIEGNAGRYVAGAGRRGRPGRRQCRRDGTSRLEHPGDVGEGQPVVAVVGLGPVADDDRVGLGDDQPVALVALSSRSRGLGGLGSTWTPSSHRSTRQSRLPELEDTIMMVAAAWRSAAESVLRRCARSACRPACSRKVASESAHHPRSPQARSRSSPSAVGRCAEVAAAAHRRRERSRHVHASTTDLRGVAGRRHHRCPGRGTGHGPGRPQLQRDRLRELTMTRRIRLLWAGLFAAVAGGRIRCWQSSSSCGMR
jgi:hypothetical protein